MGRHPELFAGLICTALFLLWKFGYPLTSGAALVPVIALLLVGAGIYLRRVRLTLAMREGIFLPDSRWKRWFSGRTSGLILAVIEGGAITLGMCHFALHAGWQELLLAAGIGVGTLAAIAVLRRAMAGHLRAEFAVAASAWVAAAAALPFCILHFWMQKNILPPPAYLESGGFMDVLKAALAELPPRRDGIIEGLGAMQLLEASIHWVLRAMQQMPGMSILLFIYNSAVCLAVGRFFADVATTFNLVGFGKWASHPRMA